MDAIIRSGNYDNPLTMAELDKLERGDDVDKILEEDAKQAKKDVEELKRKLAEVDQDKV